MANITYVLNGGTNNVGNPDNFRSWKSPITLLDPMREGYTFDGWYDNGDFIGNVVTTITEEEDDALYASWTIKTYAVEFTDYDDAVLQTAEYDYGTNLSAVVAPADPTREGYTFAGWDSEVPATMPDNKVTIQATYTINQYTISFESNGGTAVTEITDDFGEAVVEPEVPTREGYTFDDWYSDIELVTPYVFGTIPAENITLYAGWTVNTYTITYDSNEGSEVVPTDFDFGAIIVLPTDPTKLGRHFGGWFTDETLTIPFFVTEMPAENLTLYAYWYVTVTFDSNGGSDVDSQLVAELNSPEEPEVPTREGYTFDDWYEEAELTTPYDFTTASVTGDTTIYAGWTINAYTLEFVDHDATVLQTADYDFGADLSAVTAPVDATREGYTFDDWDTIIPTTMPAENITITAEYNINYTLEFVDHDATVLQTAEFIAGADISGVTAPADPTRIGYTFCGWDTTLPLTTMPAEDITIYALYDIIKYTVTFESNGGSAVGAIVGNYGEAEEEPEEPTKAGYTFDGWFTDDGTFLNKYTFDTFDQDITLYAGWTPIAYNITYNNLLGIAHANPATYTVEDLPVTLLDPTKEGYTFSYWSGETNSAIPAGTLGDISLTAVWSAIGDFIALPVYEDTTNLAYKVNKNYIVEVKAVPSDYKYRIQLVVSPGALIKLYPIYDTKAEAQAAADAFIASLI